MFISQNTLDRINSSIERLERRVYELERQNRLWVNDGPDEGVPLKTVCRSIIDHCGMDLNYQWPTEGKVKVEKVKK